MNKFKTSLLVMLISMTASAASFADEETVQEPIPAEILVESNRTWDGDKVKYPKKRRKANVRVQISEFRPGESVDWHIHETPLYIYVMSGEFTVELLDGRKQTWEEGEAFIEVVNTIHTGYNAGDENSKLLIVFTGVKNVPFYTPIPCAPDNCDYGSFLDNGKFDWSVLEDEQQ